MYRRLHGLIISGLKVSIVSGGETAGMTPAALFTLSRNSLAHMALTVYMIVLCPALLGSRVLGLNGMEIYHIVWCGISLLARHPNTCPGRPRAGGGAGH